MWVFEVQMKQTSHKARVSFRNENLHKARVSFRNENKNKTHTRLVWVILDTEGVFSLRYPGHLKNAEKVAQGILWVKEMSAGTLLLPKAERSLTPCF